MFRQLLVLFVCVPVVAGLIAEPVSARDYSASESRNLEFTEKITFAVPASFAVIASFEVNRSMVICNTENNRDIVVSLVFDGRSMATEITVRQTSCLVVSAMVASARGEGGAASGTIQVLL